MKARAVAMAALAAGMSLGVHAAGLSLVAPPEPPGVTAGASALAMVGNSFEDAAAGTVTGARAAETRLVATDSTPARITPVVPAPIAPTTSTSAVARIGPIPPEGDGAARPVAQRPVTSATAARPTLPVAAETTEPSTTITARDIPVVRTPTAETPRPEPRAPRAMAPPPPQTEPRPGPQPAPPPQSAPDTAPDNAPDNARAGQASGAVEGTAPEIRQGTTGEAAGDQRAIARYPQLVNRHLGRLRRPDARFDGAAVVAFTIAPGGGLASVSVTRPSGNAEFDRLAVAHIQRAAPFPPPPTGAQRSFSVTVRGR